jgi:hypothetical protein
MKRQSPGLRVTIASALAAGCVLSSPAHAINLAPNGKGEVLIFPYYTVRNGFDTLISVTNTSDRTVLATMRLREASNGRAVREFHIAMSPYDVWTGAVTIDGTDGALVRTFDATCTAPALGAGPNGSTQIALTPSNFDGTGALHYDNGGRQLSRVQEGFIEVIEMGISTVPSVSIPATGSSIETSAQHIAGTPRNCASIQDIFGNAGNFAGSGSGTALPGSVFASFEAPKNVLFGSATLINVGSGQAYDATPTTIQNFRATAPIIYMPGSGKPTLAHGDAGMTATRLGGDGALVTTPNIGSSLDAVSVLLMADQVVNEFATGTTDTSSARTDWVLTFPTKHFYTDSVEAGAAAPLAPFTQHFQTTGQSCDKFLFTYLEREPLWGPVTYPEPPSSSSFGIPAVVPSPAPFDELCGSVSVRAFESSFGVKPGILASAIAFPKLYFDISSGRAWITFPLVNTQVRRTPAEVLRTGLFGFDGLPVIGFALVERNNSAEAGNNRNYGSTRAHLIRLLAR